MRILDTITGFLFNKVTDTVFWRIDKKGRLILFGRGGIPGYAPGTEYFRKVPWKGRKFKQVMIGKGITDIHPTALLGIDLDKVILEKEGRRGDGLEINEAGLYNRLEKKLLIGRDQEYVEIPAGTEKIHPFAFAFHQKIKKVKCPSSLKEMCVSAFEGCRNLKNVYGIPAEAEICIRVFKGTNGLNIYRDRYPAKRKFHEMYPKTVHTKYGRAFLMNGAFVFWGSENARNIDPTPFYRCQDLIDIKGGEDFLVGLRANGRVIYEKVNPFYGVFDYYPEPFCSAKNTGFERLRDWNNIGAIEVAGNDVVGLCKDGRVFCTRAEDERQPLEGVSDIIGIETKGERIYLMRSDYTSIQI